ncbi:MAG: hypothetical protein MUC88_00550 [Planctomycetes bacterium]|jgi:hypothetical protein|nr:hypothetical protein [Planctomycetota bacterium]
MADQTTNIKIKADARDLKAAGKAARDAFSPMAPREFKRAVNESQRELKRLVDEQLKLVSSMKGVERGSDAFKQLSKNLKDSRAQAVALKGTIDSLKGAYGEFDRRQQRRQGFVAGMAQGAGLAQYIPTGPGMMPRVAGAWLGGAARRFGGAMAAPFLMPGMGGLSSMLGAIPFLGGAAAGALQAGQGMFQSAVGFDRSKLANLFWAGGGDVFGRGERLRELNRTIGATKQAREYAAAKGAAEAARRGEVYRDMSQEELTSTFISMGGIGGAFLPGKGRAITGGKKLPGGGVMIRGEGGPPAWTGMGGRVLEADVASYGDLSAGIERGAGKGGKALAKKVQTAEDRFATARMELVKENWKKFAEAAGGMGGTGMFSPGFGVEYGAGPEQTQQMLGQFMRARGGVATANAQRQADVAMAANVGFGVNMQTSGRFGRLGGFGAGAGLAGVLKAATEQGLKGSLVPEYLEQLVQMGEEGLTRGLRIRDIGQLMVSATRSTAMLGALGVEKNQRGALLQNLNRSAQQLGFKGIQSPADMLMARAAGYNPEEGPMSYIRAMEKLQTQGMSPEILLNLFQQIQQGTTGLEIAGARGPEDILKGRAFAMSRLIGQYGGSMPISGGAGGGAEGILRAMQEGGTPEDFRARIAMIMSEQGAGDKGERAGLEGMLTTGAKGLARRGAGLAVTSAGLESQRVGVGASMASTFVGLEKVGIASVRTLANFNKELTSVVGIMQRWVGALDALAKGKITLWDILRGNIPVLKPPGARGGGSR